MSRFLVALLLLLWTIPALAEGSPPRGEDRTGDRDKSKSQITKHHASTQLFRIQGTNYFW